MALGTRKVSGAFEKRAPGLNKVRENRTWGTWEYPREYPRDKNKPQFGSVTVYLRQMTQIPSLDQTTLCVQHSKTTAIHYNFLHFKP